MTIIVLLHSPLRRVARKLWNTLPTCVFFLNLLLRQIDSIRQSNEGINAYIINLSYISFITIVVCVLLSLFSGAAGYHRVSHFPLPALLPAACHPSGRYVWDAYQLPPGHRLRSLTASFIHKRGRTTHPPTKPVVQGECSLSWKPTSLINKSMLPFYSSLRIDEMEIGREQKNVRKSRHMYTINKI